MSRDETSAARGVLRAGIVIPAHPLALTSKRSLDERRQRALTRYYIDAGAGGLAVGVHTTQFAIRERGLYEPVLRLAAETARTWPTSRDAPIVLVAGLVGDTPQAIADAETAVRLGYHCGLLSLGAHASSSDESLLAHCRAVADVIPVMGFYLQRAVGGRELRFAFWRRFAEIENVWAIKVAPFDRYATLDVIRAVGEVGRDDIALYTGNDDSIVHDLVTPFPIHTHGAHRIRYFDGGLLGQWAVWTHRAVELFGRAKDARLRGAIPSELLREGAALTEANAAIFDAAHNFAGCIPGIHEVLRRQGFLEGTWCLDEREQLSSDQSAEIERVWGQYPFLSDEWFVREGIERWLG